MSAVRCRRLLYLMILPFYFTAKSALASEEQIQEALKAMYIYDFSQAQAIFEKFTTGESFHPLAPLGALATKWLGDQEMYGYLVANDHLLSRIDATIKVYKDYMQNHGESAEIYFYLGATLGLKARVALGRKEWLAVLFNGYNAVAYIRKAARLQPDFVELQLPLGVFNYYVGISRNYMRIAAFILQTSGNKDEGLKQIHAAALNAPYGQYEARGLLAFIYLYLEGQPERAYHEAQWLVKAFPPNPYYHFLAAEALLAMGETKAAEKEIHTLSRLIPKLKAYTQKEYRLRQHLLEGELAFAQGNWVRAQEKLKIYVDNYDLESDIPLTIALVKLGQIADLLGQRPQAIHYYRRAIALDNRTVACRQAALYLNSPYQLP